MSNGASTPGSRGAARRLDDAPWLKSPSFSTVIAALATGAGEVRVVGGAVRNALLGHPISDVDLATTLPPEDVMWRAGQAGLGVHPTGIDHGTVTIVSDTIAFEVTTLRRDVETDGRRAVIAFSSDWREDASRRDFTMNALYASPDGEIFDYFDGIADLEAGRVRFIGDPHKRIREDYLRILRFFRFNAHYGRGEIDAQGLAACVELKDGIARLSAERIGAELLKLVSAPRAANVVNVMAAVSILNAVLGSETYPARLERLCEIEEANGFSRDRWARLAALALDGPKGASLLAARLRLSHADQDALAAAASLHAGLDPETPETAARAWLYHRGADAFRRAALVAWARSAAPVDDAKRIARVTLPERWIAPKMPVRGADILSLGVKEGASVGRILERFEAWWIAAGFPDDPAVHKAKLADLAASGY